MSTVCGWNVAKLLTIVVGRVTEALSERDSATEGGNDEGAEEANSTAPALELNEDEEELDALRARFATGPKSTLLVELFILFACWSAADFWAAADR